MKRVTYKNRDKVGDHSANGIFKLILLYGNSGIWTQIWLKHVPEEPINDKSALIAHAPLALDVLTTKFSIQRHSLLITFHAKIHVSWQNIL